MTNQFKNDVREGLSASPKFLSSKYFYDAIGDELFVEIMNMPEYYLTDSEFEIFSKQTQQLIDSFEIEKASFFELIELGAGDGLKTKELLSELISQGFNFDYIPIDISEHTLNKLKHSLQEELKKLNVRPKRGEYFEVLSSLKSGRHKKIVLFLGSNIGNLSDDHAHKFIHQLGSNIKPNDVLLIGVDLIKSAEIVLPAYNDSAGITARFNLNLLNRINNELGGNFDLSQFEHQPRYSEETGVAESFLVSKIDQTVFLEELNQSFLFRKGEKIHTEQSRKYSDEVLNEIITNTDFQVISKISDSKDYFADYILRRN